MARRTMRVLQLGAILGLVLATAGSVVAHECAQAREHLVIARRALQVHDYTRAIAEYRASYEEDGNPVTLILLARTHAQLGELPTAIDLYRSYLDAVPTGRRTFYVEAEIARLSNLLLEQRVPIFDDSDVRAFPALPVIEDVGPLSRH